MSNGQKIAVYQLNNKNGFKIKLKINENIMWLEIIKINLKFDKDLWDYIQYKLIFLILSQ